VKDLRTRWTGKWPIALLVGAFLLALSLGVGLATATAGDSNSNSSVSPAVAKGIALEGNAAPQAKYGGTASHVTVGHSSKNDTSAKLRNMPAIPVKPSANKPAVPNPVILHQHTNRNLSNAHTQTKLAAPHMPGTTLNFEGIDFPGVNCFCAPPDTNGEVGATQYVQIVNEGLQVFDKTTGNSVLGPISIESLWQGFGGVCETSGEGDPVALYDQLAGRWVVSQFAGSAQPTHECVAVSTSSDATGSWNRYDFDLGTQFGNNFYDYPKLGVWPDAYYMSMNVFNASGTAFLGPQPFAMDRTAMLAGNPATIISTGMLTSNDDQLMPADVDGSIQPPAGAPNPFTEIGTNPTWKLWRFHVDFVNPANSTFTQAGTLTPDPFNVICGGGSCVPQAGVPDTLDTLGDRSMFRNAYRRFPDGHEALVGNMTVDSNGVAGIRWWEINNATSGTPGFVQQSTYQPDNTWRWMGSAAMDASGDIAVGFSASSSSIHPELRYAGRLAGDPPNTLGQGEASFGPENGSQIDTVSRWGDYSDLTVDPNDDCTFWYTSEYYQTNSSFNWRTRIGNFKFPGCTAGPSGTLAGTVTDSSNNNPIAGATVDAESGGQSLGTTTTDANGHYSMNLPVGTYDVTFSAFGYGTKTESGVQITDGNTTTLDEALTPQANVTVSGNVTDGSGHGWPLYARIDVAGDPASPFFTDPITGHYSISLPANASYNVTVTSKLPGYQVDNETLVVGGTDMTHDVQLQVTPDCTAPGYKQDTSLSENFDGSNNFPPAGWSVTDPTGNGEVWQLNDPEGQQNATGGSGNFADINSDFYGPSNSQDTSLVTPALNLSSASAPFLTFHNNYVAFSPYPQTGDVDVSTDGGSTWTNVWHHGMDGVPGPDLETVQLPQAANQSNVQLRFHFTSTFGFWWMVDDVTLHNSANCVTIPGGLVEGNVSDLTTGAALNGAKVTSNDKPDENTKTFAVPDDPNNPGGYYFLFSSLTGSHPFTATASLHSPDTETVNVAANNTVRQDFKLGSGHLVITPTSLTSTQVLGSTATKTLSFHNDGTGAAHVKLGEAGGSSTILQAQGAPLYRIHLSGDNPASPAFLGNNEHGGAPPVNAGGPKDPSWATIAQYPTAIMDNSADFSNGKEYSFGGIDSSFSITNKGFVYDPTGNAWTPTANMGNAREKPGVAAVNGKLYVTGGWNSSGTPIAATEVYDPASDSWSTVSPNPSPTAAPGVATANGKIYFVGGCADSACTPSNKVEVYDPASDSWSSAANYPTGDSWEGCGGINGKVYCVGGVNGSTTLKSGYVYDPSSDSWSSIADLPIDLWGMVAGGPNGMLVVSSGVTNGFNTITNQGFAYTPSTDSWTAIANAQFPRYRAGGGCGFYKIGGSSGGFSPTPDSESLGPGLDQCGTTDVPWLSESPTEFDVPVGATVNVTVTFSATAAAKVLQPGTYTAQLLVNANTPQTINPIGVTMNVTPPKDWGKLAGTVTGTDCNNVTKPLIAVVFADSKNFSWNAKTDKNGKYGFWGPKGSYTLIASANGWIPQTKTASIKAGKTVTVNFNLRPVSC
jgi:carboxypeptidase family protein/Kelch motif protein